MMRVAKSTQNGLNRCTGTYRKLAICLEPTSPSEFQDAGFNRSPTPPHLILAYSVS
jgi:hypothetical protein